jgi:hypothetical protein
VKPAVDWYVSSAVARILPEQQLQLWKGTPVVAGKAGGIPLQIQNGSGGYLVESVEECAERTLSLLRDRTRADAIASAGRETVPQALSAHQIDCRRTAASRIAAWRWSPSINSGGSDRACWGKSLPGMRNEGGHIDRRSSPSARTHALFLRGWLQGNL